MYHEVITQCAQSLRNLLDCLDAKFKMGAAFPITSCGEAKVEKNFAAPKGARRISRLAAAELLCEKPLSGASLVGPGSAYSICLGQPMGPEPDRRKPTHRGRQRPQLQCPVPSGRRECLHDWNGEGFRAPADRRSPVQG